MVAAGDGGDNSDGVVAQDAEGAGSARGGAGKEGLVTHGAGCGTDRECGTNGDERSR